MATWRFPSVNSPAERTTPSQGGRLQQITAGTSGSPTSLLDLQYYTGTDTPTYDPAGNLLTIRDYKMGSPQVQTFTYDALHRLDSAKAESGTDGNYSLEDYTYDSAGRLSAKPPTGTLTYQDSAHIHAATHINGVQKYWYDANGNQTKRIIGSDTYDLAYDQENRLVEVQKNSVVIATFVYNGDGQRVKQTLNSVTTAFVGEYYEVTATVRKNYFTGAQLIAFRDSGTLRYVFGDHLGSSTVTADVNGANVTKQLFKAWGETRSATSLATKYQYTGQYNYTTDFGLQYFRARYYDPALGRFASADTVVPLASQGMQAWDRYAYVNDNPVNYTDPSGHGRDCGNGEECRVEEKKKIPPPPPPPDEPKSSTTATQVPLPTPNPFEIVKTACPHHVPVCPAPNVSPEIQEQYYTLVGINFSGPSVQTYEQGGWEVLFGQGESALIQYSGDGSAPLPQGPNLTIYYGQVFGASTLGDYLGKSTSLGLSFSVLQDGISFWLFTNPDWTVGGWAVGWTLSAPERITPWLSNSVYSRLK